MSTETQAPLGFACVETADPHLGRAKQILAAHPEVRKLSGRDASSGIWTVGLVALQLAIGIGLAVYQAPWWSILPAAFLIGAFANHALFVLIHDYTHNLVFRKVVANKLGGILANVPIIFPAAIGFRNFHMLHHRNMGVLEFDGDMPSDREARWVGNSRWRRLLWVTMFWAVQGILRPNQIASQPAFFGWSIFNCVAMVAAMAPIIWFFGWMPIAYLFLSTVFALGPHPVGGRWFQEHYIFEPGQETYSYYGGLNKLSFNVGHHNEHHDFPGIPWSRLPELRAAAPEFYDTLYYHTSWSRILMHVLFDPDFTPHNRIMRPARFVEVKEAA